MTVWGAFYYFILQISLSVWYFTLCWHLITLLNSSKIFEPPHDKTNKMTRAPSEDSDQPGHPPIHLIRVFTVCIKNHWALSYPLSVQQRLWSDWVDAQADLSLHWVHRSFVGFVMRQLVFLRKLGSDWWCFTSHGLGSKLQLKLQITNMKDKTPLFFML